MKHYTELQFFCSLNHTCEPDMWVYDLSNGVGVEVGIGIGLRNISEGCFKTTKVNKYKSRAVYRAMLGYGNGI